MSSSIALAPLLQGFFHDWLNKQRDVSARSVRSYRDTWRLFLRFAADHHRRPVTKLRLLDLGAPEVLAFLEHVERDRHVSVGTRNCRLAALRSFFGREGRRCCALSSRDAFRLNGGEPQRAPDPPDLRQRPRISQFGVEWTALAAGLHRTT